MNQSKSGGALLPAEMKCDRAPRQLKIALVYSRMPLPMTRADQMTVAHLIGFLAARGHQVDLYALDTGEKASPEQLEWLRRKTRSLRVFPQGRLASATQAILALIRRLPLQVGWFTNSAQTKAVREALKTEDYDVAYCYYIRSAEILRDMGPSAKNPNKTGPVTVLAMQLSQALNTRRIAENSRDWKDKLIYYPESWLTRAYEARIWQHYTRTALIGQKDVEAIQAACKAEGTPTIDNWFYAPHGVDISRFTPTDAGSEDGKLLVFSGVMRTNTNVNAVLWFVKNVWPLVLRENPDARLRIVGRSPKPEITALGADPRIEVTGEVADPAQHIREATVCINPMQAGAGMQNKLIEYMASAKAIVATALANEGIGGRDKEHLILADQPEEFANGVNLLLKDPALRSRMGGAARQFVEANWTWEAPFLKLEEEFYEALSINP